MRSGNKAAAGTKKESSDSGAKPVYKRVVLKLSGESLQGDKSFGVDPAATLEIASQIKEIAALGIEVAVVIGGGNIFRGMRASKEGIDRAVADYMGMIATVMNGLALQEALERHDVATRLMTAIKMDQVAEPYIRRRALRHLAKGRVVIFVGGTGNPFFTTDTTAALRATEMGAEAVVKATKVDGVYSSDPVTDPKATRFVHLSYMDVLKKKLKVMDSTAISLCMDNNIPIIVCSMWPAGNIKKVLCGSNAGTIVREE